MAVIRIAVNRLLVLPHETRTVILRDYCSALEMLLNSESAFNLAQKVAEICRSAGDAGGTLALPWIPSHIEVPCNDRADALDAATHLGNSPSVFVERFP